MKRKLAYPLITLLALATHACKNDAAQADTTGTATKQSLGAGTVAFVSERFGGDNEILMMNLADQRVARVTENVGNDLAPRFNTAGDKLLFNSRRSTAHGHNRPEIYKIEFPAKTVERMTTTATTDENQRGAWFPGDASIMFQRGTYFAPAYLRFIKMNVVTKAETLIYDTGSKLHAAPAISPADQDVLVFQSNKDLASGTFPSRLYKMNLSTTAVTNFVWPDNGDATIGGSDIDPRWSHDGQYIAFASARNGGDDYRHIYVIKANGSELTQITTGNFSDSSPDFSPDGTEIVFQSDRDGQEYSINIVNIATKAVRFVGEGRTPVWSTKTLTELGY
jgi:Tol biopolymer transport system component